MKSIYLLLILSLVIMGCVRNHKNQPEIYDNEVNTSEKITETVINRNLQTKNRLCD